MKRPFDPTGSLRGAERNFACSRKLALQSGRTCVMNDNRDDPETLLFTCEHCGFWPMAYQGPRLFSSPAGHQRRGRFGDPFPLGRWRFLAFGFVFFRFWRESRATRSRNRSSSS
jgi:hypothetical protein